VKKNSFLRTLGIKENEKPQCQVPLLSNPSSLMLGKDQCCLEMTF